MCGAMGMMDRRDHHGEEGIFRKVHFELTRRKDNNWGLFYCINNYMDLHVNIAIYFISIKIQIISLFIESLASFSFTNI